MHIIHKFCCWPWLIAILVGTLDSSEIRTRYCYTRFHHKYMVQSNNTWLGTLDFGTKFRKLSHYRDSETPPTHSHHSEVKHKNGKCCKIKFVFLQNSNE